MQPHMVGREKVGELGFDFRTNLGNKVVGMCIYFFLL